mgnify:FL=1
MDDLFAYIEETLQNNLALPIAEDFEELIVLVEELEKAVKTLLKPIENVSSYATRDIDGTADNSRKQTLY